jgi:hypothetical protein
MNSEELTAVRDDILREMYQEAEPPLDFDDVLENPDEYSDDWYRNHTLSSEKQREILNKHFDKHELTGSEITSLTFTCITDVGPTTP